MPLNQTERFTKEKLPLRIKGSYAIGQMADSISFNLFYFFYLYFLTDFAGIPAATAGTISLIAIVWDAISDPIVGNFSDGFQTKWGRRRPLMIGAMFPYAIAIYFLFNNVALEGTAKVVYFTIITVLFWTCYKFFVIPYFALGAEITDNFNERTSIRAWASVFMYIAVLVASAAPPFILEIAEERGQSSDGAWRVVAIVFALITVVAILICFKGTKCGEKINDLKIDSVVKQPFKKEKGNLFSNSLEVIKLKPVRILMLTVLLGAIVSSITSSGTVYLMSNVLFYSGSLQSIVYMVMSVATILWLPVVSVAAFKFDKKWVYSASFIVVACISVLFYFVGFGTLTNLLVFIILFQVGMSAYWTLYYSMMYDISELDEFKTGKRREGMISAIMSFSQKLGAAISMWIIGFVLELGGYDGLANVQTPESIEAIMAINTWIPGIIALTAALVALAYPLTRKRFEKLMIALELKREGKTYSEEGLEKLL